MGTRLVRAIRVSVRRCSGDRVCERYVQLTASVPASSVQLVLSAAVSVSSPGGAVSNILLILHDRSSAPHYLRPLQPPKRWAPCHSPLRLTSASTSRLASRVAGMARPLRPPLRERQPGGPQRQSWRIPDCVFVGPVHRTQSKLSDFSNTATFPMAFYAGPHHFHTRLRPSRAAASAYAAMKSSFGSSSTPAGGSVERFSDDDYAHSTSQLTGGACAGRPLRCPGVATTRCHVLARPFLAYAFLIITPAVCHNHSRELVNTASLLLVAIAPGSLIRSTASISGVGITVLASASASLKRIFVN